MRIPGKIWILAFLAYVFVLPTTLYSLLFIPITTLQYRMLDKVFARKLSWRREIALVALIGAGFGGGMTMLGELLQPGPLPRAMVKVSSTGRAVTGDFVGQANGGVYLGRHRQLVMIPQRLIDQLTVVSAPATKPPKPETLLQRLQ
jgi:hypothetical protein